MFIPWITKFSEFRKRDLESKVKQTLSNENTLECQWESTKMVMKAISLLICVKCVKCVVALLRCCTCIGNFWLKITGENTFNENVKKSLFAYAQNRFTHNRPSHMVYRTSNQMLTNYSYNQWIIMYIWTK